MKKAFKKFLPQRQTLEHQFLPAVLEITQTPPSPLGRIIAYTIMAVFTVAVLLAFFTKIDIIAVSSGKVISSGKIKLIQPLKSGAVADIFVREGQAVKKDEPLVQLKFEEGENKRASLEQQALFNALDVARLQALLTDNPFENFQIPPETPTELKEKITELLQADMNKLSSEIKVLDGQIEEMLSEQSVARAEIQKVERAIPALAETTHIKEILMKEQLVSKIQYLDLKRQLIEYEETLQVSKKQLESLEKKGQVLQTQRAQVRVNFENETRSQLQEAMNKQAILKQDLDNARWVESMMLIRAPEDGMIQEMEIHTVGGIVTPAQTLMKLVPEKAPLEIETILLNQDIGFVREGQAVSVKIDSFPYTKYGLLNGTVRHISRDAIEHEKLGLIYNVRIKLNADTITVDGRAVRLSPGMTVTAEIKTGRRKVIEYILAPFVRYSSESLRER